MSDPDIALHVRHRASHDQSISQRHAVLVDRMSAINSPLGWTGLNIPRPPKENVELSGSYNVKNPSFNELKCIVNFKSRRPSYKMLDRSRYDDTIMIGFRSSANNIDYRKTLRDDFPRIIHAFDSYAGNVSFKYHSLHYSRGGDHGVDENGYSIETNEVYKKLRADKSLDIDGRNCVYTLTPANFWDALLCERALGFGPDEVIRRLDGKVPLVRHLMDGVYIVFNDDINLPYDEFVAMNEKFKPVLGLI